VKWTYDESCACWRAYDDRAMYVIAASGGGFDVGYFPGPGPEVSWRTGLASLEAAQAEAVSCADRVAVLAWERHGCPACRTAAAGAAREPLVHVRDLDPLKVRIHRCSACAAMWEESERSVHPITPDAARMLQDR
jgi:hypothetical protein